MIFEYELINNDVASLAKIELTEVEKQEMRENGINLKIPEYCKNLTETKIYPVNYVSFGALNNLNLKKLILNKNLKMREIISNSIIEEVVGIEDVKVLNYKTFENCYIKKINLSNIEKIYEAFIDCRLENIEFEKLNSSSYGFKNCEIEGIKFLKNFNSVISISFKNCIIKNISFDNVSSIRSEAFLNSTINFKDLGKVKEIGPYAFEGASLPDKIVLNGVKLYNHSFLKANFKYLEIENIEKIPSFCFSSSLISNVKILDKKLKKVDRTSFSDCKKLENFDISLSNLSVVNKKHFKGCISLIDVNKSIPLKENLEKKDYILSNLEKREDLNLNSFKEKIDNYLIENKEVDPELNIYLKEFNYILLDKEFEKEKIIEITVLIEKYIEKLKKEKDTENIYETLKKCIGEKIDE